MTSNSDFVTKMWIFIIHLVYKIYIKDRGIKHEYFRKQSDEFFPSHGFD